MRRCRAFHPSLSARANVADGQVAWVGSIHRYNARSGFDIKMSPPRLGLRATANNPQNLVCPEKKSAEEGQLCHSVHAK